MNAEAGSSRSVLYPPQFALRFAVFLWLRELCGALCLCCISSFSYLFSCYRHWRVLWLFPLTWNSIWTADWVLSGSYLSQVLSLRFQLCIWSSSFVLACFSPRQHEALFKQFVHRKQPKSSPHLWWGSFFRVIHEKYVTVQDFSFDIKQGCERIPAAATVSVAHLQAALVPPGTDQRLMGSRSVSGCVCVCVHWAAMSMEFGGRKEILHTGWLSLLWR